MESWFLIWHKFHLFVILVWWAGLLLMWMTKVAMSFPQNPVSPILKHSYNWLGDPQFRKRAQVSIIIWKHVLRIFQNSECCCHAHCTVAQFTKSQALLSALFWSIDWMAWPKNESRGGFERPVWRNRTKNHTNVLHASLFAAFPVSYDHWCCDFVYWPFLNDTSQQLGYSPW